MKPESVAIATLGVCPAESRALIAATRVLEGRLPALIDWFDTPMDADVVVRNLDTDDAALASLTEGTVIVPYRASGKVPEPGISRPLRMSMLQDVLTWALEQALAQRHPGPEQVARKVYRGRPQVAFEPSLPSAEARHTPAASPRASSGFARVYRGRTVK